MSSHTKLRKFSFYWQERQNILDTYKISTWWRQNDENQVDNYVSVSTLTIQYKLYFLRDIDGFIVSIISQQLANHITRQLNAPMTFSSVDFPSCENYWQLYRKKTINWKQVFLIFFDTLNVTRNQLINPATISDLLTHSCMKLSSRFPLILECDVKTFKLKKNC